MTLYSHSRLSAYESCPLKYKFRYIDKIKVEGKEGVEAFTGKRVHETLEKQYKDIMMEKLNSKEELLQYFNDLWEKHWDDDVVIVKKDYTPENYRKIGERCVNDYYDHYKPFNDTQTLGLEERIIINLDKAGKYQLQGYIDRISERDGVYEVHDYKTNSRLPLQKNLDEDRQLALYSIGIKERFKDAKDVELIWHYVAFDKELKSTRTDETLKQLKKDTLELIKEIEAAKEFSPNESPLCNWCEYQALCPRRKHLVEAEELPPNKYLKEPGVKLVNKYVEVYYRKKEMGSELGGELDLLKEAIIEYSKKNDVTFISGSEMDANISIKENLSFHTKSDEKKEELDELIRKIGKWNEVSKLDIPALGKAYKEWDKKLAKKVEKFTEKKESTRVTLRKKPDEH